MKLATATCYWCDKPFKYYQISKPRRHCSGACEYFRERHMQNERRRARKRLARSGALSK